MPSWAQASSEPICSSASRQIWARRDPPRPAARGCERRAAIAANSAPTKNAFSSSSRTVTQTATALIGASSPSAEAVGVVGRTRPRLGRPAGTNRSRSTRIPSIASTVISQPGMLDGVADDGDAAELGHDEAADGLVGRPVRDHGAEPLAHLVGAPQARGRSTTRRSNSRPVVRNTSCSSRHLADDLLDDVLQGDDAGGPAVLVDDDGQLQAVLAQHQQQRVEPDRLGHEQRRHHQRRHRHVGAALVRHGDGALDVDDAVDVVPVLAGHREPRVAGAPGQPHDVLGGGGALDRRSPGPAGSSRRPRSAHRSRATW